MSRLFALLLLSVLSLSLVSALNIQYIVNGDFEGPTIPATIAQGNVLLPSGWTVINPYSLFINVTANGYQGYLAENGNEFLEIGTYPNMSTPSPGFPATNITLEQFVTVPEASEIFMLSFYMVIPSVQGGAAVQYEIFAGFNGNLQLIFSYNNPINSNETELFNSAPGAQPGVVGPQPCGGAGQPNCETSNYIHFTDIIQAPPTPAQGNFGLVFVFLNTNDTGHNQPNYFQLDNITLFGPSIVGDPQFVGLRGQSFQVHGMDGEVYNLISDKDLQVNSRFVFLTEGVCPVIKGRTAKNCWSHAGSYLGSIGLQQFINGKLEQLAITAGPAQSGFAEILLNDQPLKLGQVYENGAFSVSYNHTHLLSVQTPSFSFRFDNSDYFINQQVSANKPLSQLTSHGLFGQTHARKIYNTPLKYIVGEADDYAIADNNLFGADFVYNQFKSS